MTRRAAPRSLEAEREALAQAMAPHLGRELAHERAGALLGVLEYVTNYDDVGECIAHARVTVTTARWADYPRPSLEACAQATVAACGVLRAWADAPALMEVV